MASMILIGIGQVSDMSNDAAKWFSSFYALYSGVAFLSITAVFFAPIIHGLLHILHVEDEELEWFMANLRDFIWHFLGLLFNISLKMQNCKSTILESSKISIIKPLKATSIFWLTLS
jgi:hypothetical protein